MQDKSVHIGGSPRNTNIITGDNNEVTQGSRADDSPSQEFISSDRTPLMEDIVGFKKLLIDHRKTLSFLLRQKAIHGTAFTPPGVNHGIQESRDQIKHIKNLLREWGVEVQNHPCDEEENI